MTPVSQNYETMKRKSETMRPVSQKLVSAFFFVCNGKNETNETNFAQIMKP